MTHRTGAAIVAVVCALGASAAGQKHTTPPPSTTPTPPSDAPKWNPRAAAASLDARMEWWLHWQGSQRDHDTACVSCHTAAPYALARPALHAATGDSASTNAETGLYANVVKRVTMWREVEPFYPDQTRGLPKSSESRGTEAVLNALVLSARDARGGAVTAETRQAFANLWALQFKAGELKGAWAWLNFHYEPWESNDSAYFGAALAAMAVGLAPGYAASPEIHEQVALLRDYIQRGVEKTSLFNRAMALWAFHRMPDRLGAVEREAIVDAAIESQGPDGGWSMAKLGSWKRGDGTAIDTGADGYATAVMTLALRSAATSRADAAAVRGAAWLMAHQDPATGGWTATSLNKQRDPASDAAKFMSDAATAYASLALATR